jgi:hypothetical protein
MDTLTGQRGRPHWWTAARDDELARRWARGETFPQIGAALGCSPGAVRNRKELLGVRRSGEGADALHFHAGEAPRLAREQGVAGQRADLAVYDPALQGRAAHA